MSLYVLPAYARSGYGTVLLAEGVRRLQAAGFSQVYLWVLEENQRARAFYQAMGFRPDGARAVCTIGGAELVELRYETALP